MFRGKENALMPNWYTVNRGWCRYWQTSWNYCSRLSASSDMWTLQGFSNWFRPQSSSVHLNTAAGLSQHPCGTSQSHNTDRLNLISDPSGRNTNCGWTALSLLNQTHGTLLSRWASHHVRSECCRINLAALLSEICNLSISQWELYCSNWYCYMLDCEIELHNYLYM